MTMNQTMEAMPSDDLMYQYDLLQLVENDDDAGATAAPGSDAQKSHGSDAQFQYLNVDDLLSNSGITLEQLDSLDAAVGAPGASGPAPVASSTTATELDATDEASTLLDELLLNGDELLEELTAEHGSAESPAPASHDDLDGQCLTDVDVLSSPCPSMSESVVATPPPEKYDELSGMAKIDAHHISPANSPVTYDHRSAQSMLKMMHMHSPVHSSSAEEEQTEAIDETEDIEIDTSVHEDGGAEHDRDLLQKEATYLEAQYDYLVSRARSARNARQSVKAKRRAREELQTAQKTQDNALLNQLVTQQNAYLENLKAMLAFAPVNDIRMALMTPIESYIHLGKDFDKRRQTILDLREEKLDMTYKYIEEKARGINPNQPYQYSDVFERFGKYYSVQFAVSKYEGVEVGQVVKVVYDQMAGKDESIAQAMGYLTIRESYDSIKCNFLHQRIVSSLKWSDEFEEGLPEMESNSLFFCRFAGDTAVFATDYIDKDDLHPYLSKDRIRKDVSSGVVLTAHTDENGNKSVIMKKFLMAKFHMYPHNVSEKMTDMLFSKIPVASQKVTKMLDQKLLDSRGKPLPSCTGYDAQAHHAAAHPVGQQPV